MFLSNILRANPYLPSNFKKNKEHLVNFNNKHFNKFYKHM